MDCGGRGCICIILKTLGYISNFSQEQKKKVRTTGKWLSLEVSSKKNASVFSRHKSFVYKIHAMFICICQSHYQITKMQLSGRNNKLSMLVEKQDIIEKQTSQASRYVFSPT